MKQILILTVALCAVLTASAQGAGSDSIKAQIKAIKLSEQYIYAESGSAKAKTDEVRLLALDALHVRIAEEMTVLGKTKAEITEVRKQTEEHYSALEYTNGPLKKAFVYITKGILTGNAVFAENEKKQEDVAVVAPVEPKKEEVPVVAPVEPAKEEVPVVTPVEPAKEEVPTVVVDSTLIKIEEPVAPHEDEYQVEDSVTIDLPELKEEPDTVAVTVNPVEEQKEIAPVQDQAAMTEIEERVVKEILALDTYEGIMLYLDAMKDDGRLMFGRLSTLIQPDEAFLIIVKNGKLVTILSKRNGERINLRTNQPDQPKNYKGHAVIWMKVYR